MELAPRNCPGCGASYESGDHACPHCSRSLPYPATDVADDLAAQVPFMIVAVVLGIVLYTLFAIFGLA